MQRVAQLVRHMKPPRPTGEPVEGEPGHYVHSIPVGRERIEYHVQVPPEYDPYRRYPAVLSLHGAGRTAEHQLDWWAGEWNGSGMRLGQATRHGYIVIAPEWSRRGQTKYEFSGREHAAAVFSLRDAMHRFAIDTDRVFLSGHAMGGDAAWDIGLAHPDTWAGVIPIGARSRQYVRPYRENARYVPWYFLGGELDDAKMKDNHRQFELYMQQPRTDVIVVDYIGRGGESFHEDVLNIFPWMARHQRDFYRRKFACRTMRPGDSYFWWLDMYGMPRLVLGDDGPLVVTGDIRATDGGKQFKVYVKSPARRNIVWLAPELVDFENAKRIEVFLKQRRYRAPAPNVADLLEDVRVRGDRLRPFWLKMEIENGRLLD